MIAEDRPGGCEVEPTDGIDLPMFDADGNPSGETLTCSVTGLDFERPDMIASAVPGLKFSTTTSASAAIRRKVFRPASLRKSTPRHRLLRLMLR